mmetsp:Transcript_7339/g.17901  ORF Transcript_7339/g.17901 Transcript_7339/m.17901 type:complete len:239 (+) Transcript_7339:229-945(+)
MDTPTWVNPANSSAPSAVSEANVDAGVTSPTGAAGQNGQGHSTRKSGCILSMLSILNVGLATMMTALGVLTLLHISSIGKTSYAPSGFDGDDDQAGDGSSSGSSSSSSTQKESYAISEPFLAFYMILFAVLLFLYEMMYWTPVESLNDNIRKNFGFMYGLRGKGLYLVFVGCLCFGLGKDASVKFLNYLTGICWFLGGVGHVFLYCTNAELAADYSPTASSSSSKKSFGQAPPDENVV